MHTNNALKQFTHIYFATSKYYNINILTHLALYFLASYNSEFH